MLAQQQQIQFSAFSGLYDLIVPKDNFLRKINELIDFTFIHEERVDKYCPNNERMSESPICMFKYLLLKTIYIVSDVESDLHSQQMAFQETGHYKEKIKHRYKIEPKNSELKNVHGYRRQHLMGFENMQMQGALAIFTVNLKRIIKMTI